MTIQNSIDLQVNPLASSLLPSLNLYFEIKRLETVDGLITNYQRSIYIPVFGEPPGTPASIYPVKDLGTYYALSNKFMVLSD